MQKTKSIALILGVLIMSYLVGYLAFAWTDPTASPPAGNVPVPLNVGTTNQIKAGGLGIGGAFYADPPTLVVDAVNHRVGIGTTNPGAKLEVSGSIRAYNPGSPDYGVGIKMDTTGGWARAFNFLDSSNNRLGGFGALGSADSLTYLWTGPWYDNPWMVWKGSNVGIGTTAPNYKLDVQGGQINASGGLCIAGTCKTAWDTVTNYWTASGNNIYNNNSGNVGIGTTSPGAKLEVAGQIKITGGSPGANKVLTSDAAGLASWQTLAPAGGTPTGGIIMYSGAWNFDGTGLGTGSLAGWALCNGNNGTPNLSDRFVMGTISSVTLGTTGGTNLYTLTSSHLPSHTHTFTTNISGCHTHNITINSAGAHTHSLVTGGYGVYAYGTPFNCGSGKGVSCMSGSTATYFAAKSTSPPLASAQSAGDHSHTSSMGTCGDHSHGGTTNSTGSGTSFDNRPAFIQLAFIKKL